MPVDSNTACAVIVANHYSGKWNTAFGTHNYGIYDEIGLAGVAVYGNPMNPKSTENVAEAIGARVVELNRLWIDDRLGHNTETWFMARCHKLLRADGIGMVQTFADGRLGVGTIYQAAAFQYLGYHETLFHRHCSGEVLHGVSFENTSRVPTFVQRNLLHATGEIEATFKVRTYRYEMGLTHTARKFIGTGDPYPKERVGESVIDGYTPPIKQIARATAMAEAMLHPYAHTLRDYLYRLGGTDKDVALASDNPYVAEIAAENECVMSLF